MTIAARYFLVRCVVTKRLSAIAESNTISQWIAIGSPQLPAAIINLSAKFSMHWEEIELHSCLTDL